jgi:predicted lipid-binding transport protein (Tim44 family)
MGRWRVFLALALAAGLALAPALAEARAGGSYGGGGFGSFSSQGSRGSRTFDQPMQRSITPQSPATSGQPGYGAGYGYGNSHPFWTGLAGGLFGGWLGSMLFPHWGMGYGTGFGSVIGSVFSWMLIIWLLWMGYRFLARRWEPLGAPAAMGYGGLGGGLGLGGPGVATARAPVASLAISGADYQAFEATLKHVQEAWSNADLAGMRHYVTPEMLSYFSEELAENESKGVVNKVEQIELVRGDLREAWDEGRLQYATCLLRWRALDYTLRSDRRPGDPDAVVGGDPRTPAEAGELWTFCRSPGGHWLLSAIQQV